MNLVIKMNKLLFILCALPFSFAQFENLNYDTDFVTVRNGAHMFYWLYYTRANVASYTDRPLMIWLQGGPGGSSTAIGNFQIMGPLNLTLQERNYTWVNDFNVLYVDNPVGTGFSYVDNLELLCTTDACIGTDFVNLMRGFFEKHPEFQTVPTYIYGQSYGGKMAVDIALQLLEESNNGLMDINLRGMAMGNAWIHPFYLTYGWADILYSAGLIEEDGVQAIVASTEYCETFYNQQSYVFMLNQWYNTQWAVFTYTNGVDFYDITTKYPSNAITRMTKGEFNDDMRRLIRNDGGISSSRNDEPFSLDYIMNTVVRQLLNIPDSIVWDSQSDAVFDYMAPDFMTPCVEGIERLLNESNILVVKYQGNMDLICETSGQLRWVDELNWAGAEQFKASPRRPIWVQNRLEGYYKAEGNFRFYWINTAGHSVPRDNPFGTSAFLQDMTGYGGYN